MNKYELLLINPNLWDCKIEYLYINPIYTFYMGWDFPTLLGLWLCGGRHWLLFGFDLACP